MAERQVSLEFVFDRAGEQAVASAYRVLVPERRARTAPRRDDDHSQQSGSQLVACADDDRPALGA